MEDQAIAIRRAVYDAKVNRITAATIAKRIGISAGYLCAVINGREKPAENLLSRVEQAIEDLEAEAANS